MTEIKKITSNFRDLLKNANEKLDLAYSEKASNPNMEGTLFQNCIPFYKNIMNLIESHQKNNISSDLLSYYYLSACFGHIKASFNGLPENPSNENKDIISSNEAEIEKLSESLDSLKSEVNTINIFNEKNVDGPLTNDFEKLCEEINAYSDKWEENVAYRKAVYCYNTGISLLEDETTTKDFPNLLNQIKENHLNTAIICFNLSKFYYKAANSTEDAASILPYISVAKEKLNQLKASLAPTLKRKKSHKMPAKQDTASKKLGILSVKNGRFNASTKTKKEIAVANIAEFVINTTPKPSASSAIIEPKNQAEASFSHKVASLPATVAPKKRKNSQEMLDNQEHVSKKLRIPLLKKVRFNILSKPEEEIATANIAELAINSTPKLSTFSNQVEPKNQAEASFFHKVANLPFFVISEKIKNKILIDRQNISSKKSYISPEQITTSILLTPEEKMLQRRKQQYEQMLNQVSSDNPYRFYSRLFFDLSTQLKHYSKKSSNHTLLTKLSWLTIAKQLIQLSPDKNEINTQYLENILNTINILSATQRKALTVISTQKRAEAYPTYEESDLHSENLPQFFINEIADYYYGLDVLDLSSAAKHFLDLIPKVINVNSVDMTSIETSIQSAHKPIENLFYAQLLRELVKFHICDENAAWYKNSFLPGSKKQLVNEYLRILTISNYFAELSDQAGRELKNKIERLANHLKQKFNLKQESTITDLRYSTNTFFPVPQPTEPLPASTDLLIKTLREHIQCLIKHRANSITTQIIHHHLLVFIQTYCEQEEIHNKSFKPSKP